MFETLADDVLSTREKRRVVGLHYGHSLEQMVEHKDYAYSEGSVGFVDFDDHVAVVLKTG